MILGVNVEIFDDWRATNDPRRELLNDWLAATHLEGTGLRLIAVNDESGRDLLVVRMRREPCSCCRRGWRYLDDGTGHPVDNPPVPLFILEPLPPFPSACCVPLPDYDPRH